MMKETLLIQFNTRDAKQAHWCLASENGQLSSIQTGAIADCLKATQAGRIVLLVPGDAVLLTQAQIPGSNRQRLRQALPYALEDQLASDVEELHFAPGQTDTNGQLSVMVAARSEMENWLSPFHQLDLEPDLCLPDVLALPHKENQWTLLLTPEHAMLRTGHASGFTCHRDILANLLKAAVSESPPERISVYRPEGVRVPPELEGLELEILDYQGSALGILAEQAIKQSDQNLLQGEFSRREQFGKLLQPLRIAAGLLLTVMVLQMGMGLYDRQRLNQRIAQLDKDIEQTYRKAFPDSRNVVNPKIQMERQLSQLQAQRHRGDDFQRLVKMTEKAVSNFPSVRIDGLDFRTNRLDLKLVAGDLQVLDKLKQSIEKTDGLSVTIVSATNRKQGVESRLRIQGGAS